MKTPHTAASRFLWEEGGLKLLRRKGEPEPVEKAWGAGGVGFGLEWPPSQDPDQAGADPDTGTHGASGGRV